MAKGVPVVCARISELSRWIEANGTGLTYAPGDAQGLANAILKLARDAPLRLETARRAQECTHRDFSYHTPTTQTLRQWVGSPGRAPDLGTLPTREGVDALLWVWNRQRSLAQSLATGPTPRRYIEDPAWQPTLRNPTLAVKPPPDKQGDTGPAEPGKDGPDQGLETFSDKLAGIISPSYLALVSGWREALAWCRRPWLRRPSDGRASVAARPRGARPRVLIVSPFSVFPPFHGSAVRLWSLIRRLHQHCDLYLFAFSFLSDDPAQREALAPFCRKVFFHRRDPVPPGSMGSAAHGGPLLPLSTGTRTFARHRRGGEN